MKKVASFAALFVLMIGLTACESDTALSEQDALYDAECTTCGADIDKDADCTTCGADIDKDADCTTCGADIDKDAECTTCGADIDKG